MYIDFLEAQGLVEPIQKPVETLPPSPPQTRGLGKKRRNAVEDVKKGNESEDDEEDEEIRRLEVCIVSFFGCRLAQLSTLPG